MKKKFAFWKIPVPEPLNEALEKALENSEFCSKSEFIRSLVRRELERRGFYPPDKEVGS